MRTIIVLILLNVFGASLLAQNSQQQIEKQALQQHYKKISYYWLKTAEQPKSNAYDSIEIENNLLMDLLVAYLNKYPTSIHESFDSLQDGAFRCATSNDGKFRIYSWNTFTGGTMQYFDAVSQFQTSDGVKTKILCDVIRHMQNVVDDDKGYDNDDEEGSIYDTIYSVNIHGSICYLATTFESYSTQGRVAGIKAFSIEGIHLNDSIKPFKTDTGFANEITYEYNMQVNEKTHWEITVPPRFNTKTLTLSIPIIAGDSKMHFTGRYCKYRFNGQYFVKE